MERARPSRDWLILELPGGRGRRRRRAAAVALEGAAGAEFRRALALARAFDPAPILVAVDGGLSACLAIGRRPDLFVGDLDSARTPPASVAARIYPADKDFSDFAGALREVRRLGAEVVVAGGLLGGRLDHEWANLAEIGAAASAFAAVLAATPRGVVVVTSRGVRARTAGRRLVSVFAVHRAARVTLRGVAWPLTRHRLVPGSLGLSNVASARMTVAVHSGVVAVVFPRGSGRT